MTFDYTRRQNTNGLWEININHLIEEGEESKNSLSISSFQDLRDYYKKVNEWLEKGRTKVCTIYKNPSVVEIFCPAIDGIDLKEIIRSEAISFLKDTLSKRIEDFRELIHSTKTSTRTR